MPYNGRARHRVESRPFAAPFEPGAQLRPRDRNRLWLLARFRADFVFGALGDYSRRGRGLAAESGFFDGRVFDFFVRRGALTGAYTPDGVMNLLLLRCEVRSRLRVQYRDADKVLLRRTHGRECS